ncbi:MAG: hypothetical protein GY861_03525 [bacterium]|nr:hypothetical protein [bacterium]
MTFEVAATVKEDQKVEEYEIRGWMETLKEAEEIRACPDKMKLVTEYAAKESKKIKSIADLEERANSFDDADPEDEGADVVDMATPKEKKEFEKKELK